MNKLRVVLLTVAIVVMGTVAKGANVPEPNFSQAEMLYFTESAGLSSFAKKEISIGADGSGKASLKYVTSENRVTFTDDISYPFRLNPFEIETLKSLVRAVDFFEQPDKDTEFATDQGNSVLRVDIGGKKRELHYSYRRKLYPLTTFLYKIVRQAQVMTSLEKRGYTMEAVGLISPYCAENNSVLQPYIFKEPLLACAHRSSNEEQLTYVASGLSYLMTPEEWSGFWAGEIRGTKEPRRTLILKAVTALRPINPVDRRYQKAITPVLFECLVEESRGWPDLPAPKREICKSIVRIMGDQRYTKAIPLLVSLMPYGYEPASLTRVGGIYAISSTPLSQMGRAAVDAIGPLLKDSRPTVRAVASLTLGRTASYVTSRDQYALATYHGSPEDPKYILGGISSLLPELRNMMAGDPDSMVREEARVAIEQIEQTSKAIP